MSWRLTPPHARRDVLALGGIVGPLHQRWTSMLDRHAAAGDVDAVTAYLGHEVAPALRAELEALEELDGIVRPAELAALIARGRLALALLLEVEASESMAPWAGTLGTLALPLVRARLADFASAVERSVGWIRQDSLEAVTLERFVALHGARPWEAMALPT